MLLAIDIGNTHTHYGILDGTRTLETGQVRTREIDDPSVGLPAVLPRLRDAHPGLRGVGFCSVVPTATARLRPVLAQSPWAAAVHELTCHSSLGVPISYPRPQEIGPDRLANAAGIHALGLSTAVVIDMGTAVTFDMISASRGYEGGIIAPGVEVMRRYLHEQTALLPLLDDNQEVPRAIGQSTLEAMRIGTVLGFAGMIQALLDAVLAEWAARGETAPALLTTGGSARLLEGRLRQSLRHEPDLTLLGVGHAWQLSSSPRP